MSTVTQLVEAIGALLTQVDADLGAAEAKYVACQQEITALKARIAELEATQPVEPPPPEPRPIEPPIYTVATASELIAKAKLPGMKIIRASANLGGIDLAAVVDAIIEGVTFDSGTVRAQDSKRVTLQGCRFVGSGTQYDTRNAIMGNSGTADLHVKECEFKSVGRAYSGTGRGLKFIDNRASGLGHDFFQIGGGVVGLEIARNYATGWVSVTNAHRDFTQFGTWNNAGGIEDVHIHHNVGFMGTGQSFQFLFLGNENDLPYKRFLIEHNLCHQNHAHGITVKDCTETTVRRNTVLSSGDNKTAISVDNSAVNTIVENIADVGGQATATALANFVKGRYTLENFRVASGLALGADVDQLPAI